MKTLRFVSFVAAHSPFFAAAPRYLYNALMYIMACFDVAHSIDGFL